MLRDFIRTLLLVLLLLFFAQALATAVPVSTVFIALLIGAAGIYAIFIEPNRLVLRTRTVTLAGLPEECDGMKVALLGCIHAGSPFINTDKLRRIVTLTNDAAPDAVFLLGDFVCTFVLFGRAHSPESVAQELGRLQAPLGRYSVLGNHDLWHGKDRVAQALASAGIVVLNNNLANMNTSTGQKITLAGLAFDGAPAQSAAETFGNAEATEATIALAHSPDAFPHIPSSVMLTCASHTHGGQIRLPLFGALLVPCKTGSRYASGHFEENGKQLVVTSGIGTSMLPARFFCPPEILLLTLKRPSNS